MRKKYALDFLLFSYFGLRTIDKKEYVVERAIEKAYIDATLRSALVIKNKKNKDVELYNELYKETEKARFECRKSAKEKCIDIIKCFLEELKESLLCNQDDYNGWHKRLCEKIAAMYDKYYFDKLTEMSEKDETIYDFFSREDKEEKYFTIGNAQKWVNMTMKNLYVLSEYFELDFNEDIWKYIHIPIDNKVLKKVREKGITYINRNSDNYYIKIDNNDYSWSNIRYYKHYFKLHEDIKKLIKDKSPIEWECEVFTEMV